MSGPSHRIAIACATCACVAIAAGCGGGSSPNRAATIPPIATTTTNLAENPAVALGFVQRAIVATRASKSAHVTSRFVYDTTSEATNTGSTGVVNFQTGDAQWTSDLPSQNRGIIPDNTPFEQRSMAVRQVGGQLYVSLPAAFRSAGISATWLQTPTTRAAASAPNTGFTGLDPRIALAARMERPDVAIDVLRTVRDARVVGPASMNGTATTRYSIDVALRTLFQDVGLMSMFGTSTGPSTLAALDDVIAPAGTIDVYIDSARRVRALVVDVDLSVLAPHFSPPGNPADWRELRAEWDFDAFGAPAAVTAPTQGVQAVGQ